MSMKPETTNHLLAILTQGNRRHLLQLMELMELDLGQVLHQSDQTLQYVYFPETAVISLVTAAPAGDAVEFAAIGREGMVGLSAILQGERTLTDAVVLIKGTAWRIRADDFSRLLSGNPQLSRAMLGYAQQLFASIARTSACNLLHSIEKRCARRLLLLHDQTRERGDTFPMTQELLARMMGVQRSGVNLAAGVLQKAKLIKQIRGKITILDRSGLEAAACHCYVPEAGGPGAQIIESPERKCDRPEADWPDGRPSEQAEREKESLIEAG